MLLDGSVHFQTLLNIELRKIVHDVFEISLSFLSAGFSTLCQCTGIEGADSFCKFALQK